MEKFNRFLNLFSIESITASQRISWKKKILYVCCGLVDIVRQKRERTRKPSSCLAQGEESSFARRNDENRLLGINRTEQLCIGIPQYLGNDIERCTDAKPYLERPAHSSNLGALSGSIKFYGPKMDGSFSSSPLFLAHTFYTYGTREKNGPRYF